MRHSVNELLFGMSQEIHIMAENLHNFYNSKIYETLGCTLQAYGTNFEPDNFLKESNFNRDEIQFKGTLGLPIDVREKVEKGELPYLDAFDIFDTPFLLINISEASELLLQIEEATLFLKQHLNDLKKLPSYPNVESVLMQFIVKQDDSKYNTQNLPAEFSDLYSEIGIRGVLFRTLNKSACKS